MKKFLIGVALAIAPVLVRAEGIITELQTAATTQITAVVAAVGAVAVAGFAIPVVMWGVKKIRGAFSRS